jgi:tRNA-dihydrouridine synthase A
LQQDNANAGAATPVAHPPLRFSVAPMMDWTDRHCRYFLRLISKRALLYTEMIPVNAILYGSRDRHLRFDKSEHPVALQLGGSDPHELGQCAEIGARYGYDEINLNCGCPSERVQENSFGACLMHEPALVAEAVAEMRSASGLPVTVKHRLGVDESEDYVFMRRFVETIAEAGCETFIVHARKAWLKGLSPKENREVPPLSYETVYRLKQEFPQLNIVINGGIKTLDECDEHLKHVDGVMLGREIYDNPYLLADVDRRIFGEERTVPSRADVINALIPYVKAEMARGAHLHLITRHILGLYRGQAGGRAFRRTLSEGVSFRSGDYTLLEDVLYEVEQHALQEKAA